MVSCSIWHKLRMLAHVLRPVCSRAEALVRLCRGAVRVRPVANLCFAFCFVTLKIESISMIASGNGRRSSYASLSSVVAPICDIAGRSSSILAMLCPSVSRQDSASATWCMTLFDTGYRIRTRGGVDATFQASGALFVRKDRLQRLMVSDDPAALKLFV